MKSEQPKFAWVNLHKHEITARKRQKSSFIKQAVELMQKLYPEKKIYIVKPKGSK